MASRKAGRHHTLPRAAACIRPTQLPCQGAPTKRLPQNPPMSAAAARCGLAVPSEVFNSQFAAAGQPEVEHRRSGASRFCGPKHCGRGDAVAGQDSASSAGQSHGLAPLQCKADTHSVEHSPPLSPMLTQGCPKIPRNRAHLECSRPAVGRQPAVRIGRRRGEHHERWQVLQHSRQEGFSLRAQPLHRWRAFARWRRCGARRCSGRGCFVGQQIHVAAPQRKVAVPPTGSLFRE